MIDEDALWTTLQKVAIGCAAEDILAERLKNDDWSPSFTSVTGIYFPNRDGNYILVSMGRAGEQFRLSKENPVYQDIPDFAIVFQESLIKDEKLRGIQYGKITDLELSKSEYGERISIFTDSERTIEIVADSDEFWLSVK